MTDTFHVSMRRTHASAQTRARLPAPSPGHLAALYTFVRVVELRSFSAVARELGVSQPTISRQVAALEERVGVRLLHRTTRRVSATPAGAMLVERGAGALRTLVEVEDDVRTGSSAATGLVRVATPGALGRRLVLPIVRTLLDAHPGLELELEATDRVVSFLDGRTDFAVRVGPQVEAALAVRKVGTSSQGFVVAASYVRAHGLPRRLADLAHHAVIGRSGGGPIAAMIGQLRRAGAQVPFTSDDIESVYLAARDGLGAAVLPQWLTAADVARGRLVPCVTDARIADVPVVLVRPEAAWLPRRARLVFDAIAAGLGAALDA